jgi:hypothetical protein
MRLPYRPHSPHSTRPIMVYKKDIYCIYFTAVMSILQEMFTTSALAFKGVMVK